MKSRIQKLASCAGLLALVTGTALAAGEKPDIGMMEYRANCASCHGISGKGEGFFAPLLKVQMPDLTVMARNNGGVFPFARVYEAIDGRISYPAHGSRDMPIWGNAYLASGSPEYDDYPYNAEFFVRSRILALIDYLNRLQAK